MGNFKLKCYLILEMVVCQFSTTVGQSHKSPCNNYSVEIIDNETYWDTIINSGFRKKEIVVPPSNLEIIGESLTTEQFGQISEEIKCEFKEMNIIRKKFEEQTDSIFEITSTTIYKSGGIEICYVLAETNTLKMQVGVIGIIADKKLITYSYSNMLEVAIQLISFEKRKNSFVLYGNQKGNPDDPYGGHFKLSFSGKKRIIEYEYYEMEM